MNTPLVLLNLNPGYDRTLYINEPSPTSGTYIVGDSVTYGAGKALNVARGLQMLGHDRYELINLLGGDIGRIIKGLCIKEGINTNNFFIAENSRMNTTVVNQLNGRSETFNEKGPIITEEEIQAFVSFLMKRIVHASGLVISGSALPQLQPEALEPVFMAARQQSIPLYADINGSWLKTITAYPLRYLKINEHEFFNTFGISHHDSEAVIALKSRLHVDNVIVTLGQDGCCAWDQHNRLITISSGTTEAVLNTVGCGDSFFAGLIYSLHFGKSLKEACLFANACGVANTQSKIPAGFTRASVDHYLAHVVRINKEVPYV